MSKLKPCPFCGGEPDVKRWTELDRAYPEPNEYDCSSVTCYCMGHVMDIDQWNTRAPDPRIKELEDEVDRCKLVIAALSEPKDHNPPDTGKEKKAL